MDNRIDDGINDGSAKGGDNFDVGTKDIAGKRVNEENGSIVKRGRIQHIELTRGGGMDMVIAEANTKVGNGGEIKHDGVRRFELKKDQ